MSINLSLDSTEFFLNEESRNDSNISLDFDNPSLKESKNDYKNYKWNKTSFTPILHPFDSSFSGICHELKNENSKEPLHFFEYFFDQKLMEILVEEANRYKSILPNKQVST